jgi:hypothetical protein
MFFKSTKWKHAYLLLPLKTRAVFAHAQSIFPPVTAGNLLSLCREIAGARDILQKFENLKKQHE